MNENHVAIKIFDFVAPPQELGSLFGLEPTKTARKGDEYGILKKTYPWNFWEHRRVRNEDRFIGDLAAEFIATVLEPRKEALKQVLSGCSGEFSVVQYLNNGCNAGFHLGRSALRTICDLGIELDVDIFCLAKDE